MLVMVPDAALVERLRQRMSQVQERHERDQQGAARAFWKALREPGDGACPGAGTERDGGGSGGAGRGARAADHGGRGARGSAGGGRAGGGRAPRARASARPVGRGVWADVDPAGPVVTHPLQVGWAGEGAMPVQDEAFLAAARAEAARRADEEELGAEEFGAGVSELGEAVRVEALVGMSLVGHSPAALTAAVEQVCAARGELDVVLVNALGELLARGSGFPDGLSGSDWLRCLDPTLTAGAAKAILTVAAAVSEPRWAELAARVSMRQVTVAAAARIVQFQIDASRVADPGQVAAAVADLLEQAPRLGERELAGLVRLHTEQVTPPDDIDPERLDKARESARGLWFGAPTATGMVPMRGVLDPEAAAIVKAAVDPLSRPCPERDEHGHTIAPDPRSPAKRRADGLLEVIGRGVAAADGVRVTDKAKVVVMIDFDTLLGRVVGAGWAGTGDVLSAASIRRLACDAQVIPMVLGRHGEPLDVGRHERLVGPGLRLALTQRDGGCSFPGCTIPAAWTDAHHVTPWYLGGVTSLLNTTLLCRRHHTHVHRHGLTATVTAGSVTWQR
ncbi:MAG: HNH endonuclease [Intrasporangium sp.]|nr:HNH endonuclease signature motif containing protein [Intrasporangium sp.]MDN5795377.1 HNH endonuclease [Intrasporangium sp.]